MLKLKLQYMATSCEELTHWKRLWCWEGLGTGGEGDDRGWDGWMASPTPWMWVWVNSGSWWWTWRPGVLQFMGLQGVGQYWATELNWTELNLRYIIIFDPYYSPPLFLLFNDSIVSSFPAPIFLPFPTLGKISKVHNMKLFACMSSCKMCIVVSQYVN